MRTRPFHRLAPIGCSLMIASCAGSPPVSEVAPPRLQLPLMATAPCTLPRLPETPTRSDLETGYAARGAALAACDAARGLAVETLVAERALQDRWLAIEARRAGPFWRRLIRK